MFKNYLKIAWRNLWKYRFYTFINIGGLALGIACCILLFQFITYHLSFDTYHRQAKHTYRLVLRLTYGSGAPEYDKGAPLALARSLKANDPNVENVGVALDVGDITVAIAQKGQSSRKLFAEHKNISLCNTDLFYLFDYQWEQGNKSIALKEPNSVVLSHSLAAKYFGSQHVLGKTIEINNNFRKITCTVKGVVKDHPANTDIKFDAFISLPSLKNLEPDIADQMINAWAFINSTTSVYISLANGTSPQTIERNIAQLSLKANGADFAKLYHFMLLPLSDLHFDSRFAGVIERPLLLTLVIVGLLILLTACINFINMAIVQSLKRSKEIGTRKVLGSSPQSIFIQFISETAYVVGFAALLAFVLVTLTIPALNHLLQADLSFDLFSNYRLLSFITAILLLITIAAGSYPAFILSRFKPLDALKSQTSGAQKQGGAYTRKTLTILQNVIAQILIISSMLINIQVSFLKSTDLGFNKDALLMLPLPSVDKSKTDYLRNQLLSNPAIKNVSFCYRAPSSTSGKGCTIKYNTHDWEKFISRTLIGDADYVKTFGLKLVAGRNIVESDTSREFLVNEKLAHTLGVKDYKEILGRKFTAGDFSNNAGIIVGVVKDFHAQSLYTPIVPEHLSTLRSAYRYAGVKIGSGNFMAAIEHIKKEWQIVFPDQVFEYRFLDEQIAEFYKKEDLLNKVLTSSTLVAIFISCLGLLGLISLLTLQRNKEIAIRKLLGASVANIIGLFSVDFLKLVIVATVIASPLACLSMHKYLQNFAYRIDISWWVFALAAFLSLLIAFATISFQTVKAAIEKPVNSLRSA